MQWDGQKEGGRENNMSPQKKKCNEDRNGRKRLMKRELWPSYVRQKATYKLPAKYVLTQG